MTTTFKKALLTGTALVAVAAFALPLTVSPAYAADELSIDADDSGVFDADELATSAFDWATNTNGTGAAGEASNAHDVQLNASATINGIQDTNTIGDATTTTAAITSNAAGLTLIIDDSVNDDAAEAVTITGDITRGSQTLLNLTITGENTDATADVLNLDINGAIDLGTGTFTIDTDTNAGNAVNVTLSGNLTAGATVLKDDNAPITLTFDGTSAQTVSGTIDGETDADGNLVIANSSGVTFSGIIGGTRAMDLITVSKAGSASSATFSAAVSATATVLGNGAGTDTNTVTYDGSTAGFTVTGTVNGTAGDTDNVVVSGGNTIVQAGVWGGVSALDALSVTGTSTILDSNAALSATATTIGTGAKIDVGAGLLTSAVANSGTLLLSGTGGVTGAITGTGTLDVNEDADVTGNITQGSATIAEGKTLTVIGAASRTVTTDILLEDATSDGTDAGLTFDNGANTTTFTGDITVGIDGEGLITFANDTGATLAIVGDVGTSSKAVGGLTITDAAGAQTLTTTGNLYVDAISLGQDDTLQFVGTSAQTVSGTISGAGAGKGILTVGDGTTASDVTFDGIIGGTTLASATVSANATTRLNANTTVVGAFTNSGTTNIAIGKTLTAGSFAGTGTYNINIEDANASGTLTAADFGSLASAGAIDLGAETVNFNFTGNTATGAAVVLGTGGAASTTAATVTDNSFIYDAALAANGNNLELTVTRTALATASSTGNGQSVGAVLDTLTSTTDTQLLQIQDQIAQASTQSALNEVLEATTPTVDLGVTSTIINVTTQSIGLTDTRLASLRTGDETTGMAAGNVGRGLRLWGQAFGSTADQDHRDGVDGYEADTFGGAVGLDTTNLSDNAVIGVAFSYADSDIDSDNANNTQTDIGSYQVTVYGDYDIDERTFLSGQFAYAFNDIESTRYNVGGVSGLTANGDYDSNQFTIAGKLGRDYATDQGLTLSPALLADYTHLSIDDYTETGAGGANLDVNSDSLNILEIGVGVDASWLHQNMDGSYLKPAVHAAYRYDVIGDNVETTSTFTGGGAAFQTNGMDPARSTFNVGAGLSYMATNNWEFSANYDYEFKSDYGAHSGLVRAAYKF
ncbi:MAG: autotransporter domain-containing protein [Rhodospirillales bacterium]|nr:autotransporter domain-containing protein [Rhodospirillales bacterium]